MQQYGLSPNWFKFLQNQFLIPKFPWADGKALKVCQKDQLLIRNYFVHVFKNLLLRYQIWQKKPTLVELLWLKCSCSSLKIAINVYFEETFWLWIYGQNNWVTTDERASWRGWICMACTWVLWTSTMKQWISLVLFFNSLSETVLVKHILVKAGWCLGKVSKLLLRGMALTPLSGNTTWVTIHSHTCICFSIVQK